MVRLPLSKSVTGKCSQKLLREPGPGHFPGSDEPLHLAGMRREQPRAAATFQHFDFFRQDIQPIRIDHHRLLDPGDEVADPRAVRVSQAGPDCPDVDLLARADP